MKENSLHDKLQLINEWYMDDYTVYDPNAELIEAFENLCRSLNVIPIGGTLTNLDNLEDWFNDSDINFAKLDYRVFNEEQSGGYWRWCYTYIIDNNPDDYLLYQLAWN